MKNHFPHPPCPPKPCEPHHHHCEPCEPPSFPDFCQTPPPRPCLLPEVPSVLEGESLYEAMDCLTERVNVCTRTYNDVMANAYETLRNMQRSACANGAFYDRSVWTEEGFLPEESAKYTLIHKCVVDEHGEPIRMQLHLAYGNTTNSQITQDAFSASEVTYADKLIPAIPLTGNGWTGNVFFQGAPINSNPYTPPKEGEAPEYPQMPFCYGFTRSGVLRAYSNTVSIQQMQRDEIENAMSCSGILVMGSALTDESYRVNIPDATTQNSRIVIGQNTETREVIILVTGYQNNPGMTSQACANILIQYGCSIAVEVCEGKTSVAMDKGQMLFVPEDNKVPSTYAYWVISRKCFYHNDFQYEIEKLTQNYGRAIWQAYLNKLRIDQSFEEIAANKAAIEQEVKDRIAGDNLLQENIDAEEAARKAAIEAEANARWEADKAEAAAREAADTLLQQNIDAEQAAREAADKQLQANIDAEEAARIAADEAEKTARESADKTLQDNIDAEQAAREAADKTLQDNIDAEAAAREAADTKLQSNIDAETAARVAADTDLQEQITKEVTDRTNADTKLQANIETEAQERQADVSRLELADQTIRDQITNIISLITAINESITKIQNDILNINKQWNEMQQEWTDLLKEFDSLTDLVNNFQTVINDLSTSIGDWKTAYPNSTVTEEMQKANAKFNNYLPLTGGTLTGALTVDYGAGESTTQNAVFGLTTTGNIQTEGILASDITIRADSAATGINMNNKPLKHIPEPVVNDDAATKQYVDEQITSVNPENRFLPLVGGQLTGSLVLKNGESSLGQPSLTTNGHVTLQDIDPPDGERSFNTIVNVVNTGLTTSGLFVGQYGDKLGWFKADKTTHFDIEAGGTLNVEATTKFSNLNIGKGTTEPTGINANGYPVKGVPTPVADTDAVNKKYVDDAISGSITPPTGDYLPLTGGQMKGAIAMGDGTTNFKIENLLNPAQPQDAATKDYVDKAIGGITPPSGDYLPLTGGTITGIVDINTGVDTDNGLKVYNTGGLFDGSTTTIAGKGITILNPSDESVFISPTQIISNASTFNIGGLSEPTEAGDAANKGYVDAMRGVWYRGEKYTLPFSIFSNNTGIPPWFNLNNSSNISVQRVNNNVLLRVTIVPLLTGNFSAGEFSTWMLFDASSVPAEMRKLFSFIGTGTNIGSAWDNWGGRPINFEISTKNYSACIINFHVGNSGNFSEQVGNFVSSFVLPASMDIDGNYLYSIV